MGEKRCEGRSAGTHKCLERALSLPQLIRRTHGRWHGQGRQAQKAQRCKGVAHNSKRCTMHRKEVVPAHTQKVARRQKPRKKKRKKRNVFCGRRHTHLVMLLLFLRHSGIATDCKTVAPFSSHLSQVLNGALLCTSRKTASHNAVMPSPYFVSEDLVVDRST